MLHEGATQQVQEKLASPVLAAAQLFDVQAQQTRAHLAPMSSQGMDDEASLG
jgi:hypothetical protein